MQDGADASWTEPMPLCVHPRANPLVELRLSLIECVLTALWVFLSAGATASVLVSCVEECQNFGDYHGNATMGMPHAAMCPPPTAQITVALVTGFAAATATGASFSANSLQAMDGREQQLDDATHSGGYISLAVTLSQALRGHITPLRCAMYAAAQLVGASLGGELLVGVLNQRCLSSVFAYAASSSHGGVGAGSLLLLNATLNAGLALTHLLCRRLQSMATPILVGFFYIAATMFSHPMEHHGHCHFNVLRVFALRAFAGPDVTDYLQYLWWGATVVGAVCGALIDVLLFDRHVWRRCESGQTRGSGALRGGGGGRRGLAASDAAGAAVQMPSTHEALAPAVLLSHGEPGVRVDERL